MPSRTGQSRREIDWEARSFLCYVRDVGLTRDVRPVLAFQWGFWIEGKGKGGEVKVKRAREVEVEEAWEECMGLFEARFPSWKFSVKE